MTTTGTTTLRLTPHAVFHGDPPREIHHRDHLYIRLWRDDGRAYANIPHSLVAHSPDGFEWGYEGSGPAELALNILGEFIAPPHAWALHQRFKRDIIAKLDRDGPHEINPHSVITWIERQWRQEQWRQQSRREDR